MEPTSIALVGRWRSEAMLRYLRAAYTPAAQHFARHMLRSGNFTFGKKPQPPETTEDHTPTFLSPDQAPKDAGELFDPTDDASDDDYAFITHPDPATAGTSAALPSSV
jgi:hypothetical protein